MLRIAYFTLDERRFPSPQIRVFGPAAALKGEVELLVGCALNEGRIEGDPNVVDAADLILVQRGFPRRTTREICDRILSCGKPVVYESDDALQHLPKHHNKPIYSDDVAPAVEEFVRHVDLVTVATEPLQALFSPLARQVVVLPNCLSSELWTDGLPAPRADPSARVRIGFVGSLHHDRDFALLAPVLREAAEAHDNVDIVSYGGIAAGLDGCPRVSTIPAHYDYALHPKRLAAARLDIAVVPLTPSRFNRCKSNIKFLEFGFLGIPGAFAALEPYRDVVDGESGFLCDERPAAWRKALFALIGDADLRRRMGKAAQEAVRGAWMLDAHKQKWLAAYDLAVRARAGSKRKPAKGKVGQ